MISPPRILVAGIGNIFLGDDAFGVHVAQRLMQRTFLPDVRVVDFGIRGLDLAYALLDGCALAILIDAVPRGDAPGTLYVMEPQLPDDADPAAGPELIEAHSMDPVKVLRLVRAMGGSAGRIILVGCEPAPIDDEADMMKLSSAVEAAIEPATRMVESLITKFSSGSLTMEVQHVD
jgi:hydrogenase maturation protease